MPLLCKNCGEDIIGYKVTVLLNGCLVVSEIGHKRIWNSPMCLEDWVDEFCIDKNETYVTGVVSIIIRNTCILKYRLDYYLEKTENNKKGRKSWKNIHC